MEPYIVSSMIYKMIFLGKTWPASVEIGTPPQPVSIQIDTGSSDLWVGPTCSTSGSVTFCQSYPVYDPHASSTALDTGYQMDLAYGEGSCSGEYWLDNVILGGEQTSLSLLYARLIFKTIGVTITRQQFGWASPSTSLPTGIMGSHGELSLLVTTISLISWPCKAFRRVELLVSTLEMSIRQRVCSHSKSNDIFAK